MHEYMKKKKKTTHKKRDKNETKRYLEKNLRDRNIKKLVGKELYHEADPEQKRVKTFDGHIIPEKLR